ncbi:hypothetical protein AB4144_43610, partial [Rhizobiaceae sp. 2RAB30]
GLEFVMERLLSLVRELTPNGMMHPRGWTAGAREAPILARAYGGVHHDRAAKRDRRLRAAVPNSPKYPNAEKRG